MAGKEEILRCAHQAGSVIDFLLCLGQPALATLILGALPSIFEQITQIYLGELAISLRHDMEQFPIKLGETAANCPIAVIT